MKTDKELIEEIKHACWAGDGCGFCSLKYLCRTEGFRSSSWDEADWDCPEAVKALALIRLGLLKVEKLEVR